ncbi:MAG: tRNA (guanosine(46)-N7)-methyltransferase TrmB [Candidatus Krumholzibacteria bacterium]|nr:tRNA (guanosine(46)-N7)-methyltransferase TrmB [Candidatus Krumholzibacteria bacterium]
MQQTAAQLQHKPSPLLLCASPRELPEPSRIFENPNPIEIEIGCGKAKFLIARAQQHPEINFLGIDVVWKWMKYGVERSGKRGLTNIKYVKSDAREVIKYGIPSWSVSIFHIYFPDPWPKRRHRKRRLITGEFLKLLHSRLTNDGLIELATDHVDYFVQMQGAVVQSGLSWQRVEVTRNRRLFEALAKTNYELKYESAGRTLRYLELQK